MPGIPTKLRTSVHNARAYKAAVALAHVCTRVRDMDLLQEGRKPGASAVVPWEYLDLREAKGEPEALAEQNLIGRGITLGA